MRARLLRVANPDAENEAEYAVETVEEALMRNGMGCVLVLAMSTPLALALTKSFQTMLSLKLGNDRPQPGRPAGRRTYSRHHRFFRQSCRPGLSADEPDCARTIAASILGISAEELTDPTEIKDAAGELLNIMTGNFKSNLCDAGLDCRLQPPEVKLSTDLHTPSLPGGGMERMAFRAEKIQLFVDVIANPWNSED